MITGIDKNIYVNQDSLQFYLQFKKPSSPATLSKKANRSHYISVDIRHAITYVDSAFEELI